jgi:protein-tyrosine-phosphatase
MAAALLRASAGNGARVESAGVYDGGGADPFVEAVLGEIGIALETQPPRRLSALDLSRFDAVIALTAEAAAELRRILPRERIEFWDIANPSDAYGGREAILSAYRSVRDSLRERLAARFPELVRST